jgi:sialidase-1
VVQADVPDAGCNGDVLRLDVDPRSPRADWLLSSNVAGRRSRSDLVLRLSRDGGRTWHGVLTVETGPAGYSTMVLLPGGDVGLLYERDGLVFTRVPLDAVIGSPGQV